MSNEIPVIDVNDAIALCEGRHGNPFAFLGPHGGRVTVWQPGAERVWLEPGTEARPVEGFPGLFVGESPVRDYRIRAQGFGSEWVQDDPYRFGPVLGEIDEYLLGEGTHRKLWDALGAHLMVHEGVAGTHFAVWAPNAQRVSVVGDFNHWDGRCHPMRLRGATGVWEIFLPGVTEGTSYKYEIRTGWGHVQTQKADPVGFGAEHPPRTASVVRDLSRSNWTDDTWMTTRYQAQNVDAPISVYEVHLGSWRRAPGNRMLSYAELAEQLIDYVEWMGFTHIELMPVSEYPFDGSWGYQPVGLFAPTIRHGTPDEFRAMIDAAHRRGIGVLLDWVPGHFPSDPHGLGQFDGTPLYEHGDPREGFHHDWNTLIYNYGRREVMNYLTANALYWLEEYHLDGLRVDAVASMLYRDYSRPAGEWVPNHLGGRENFEAIAMLRDMNSAAYGANPGIMTVAEESTSYPGVSRPVDHGGLGFGFKWNMGWMNDTLSYIQKDPIFRKYDHHKMTFGLHYAWSENFILPISHDEVVHGKGSMIEKMPGDGDQKFANLRAYYAFMWAHPGKKLLFMGCEFAQGREWTHEQSLDWHQADLPPHRGVQLLVRDLNALYRGTPALHRNDTRPDGFRWLEANDPDASVFAWTRLGAPGEPMMVFVVNFTPVDRDYRVGFPAAGRWEEVLNTDSSAYGGQDRGNFGGITTEPEAWHGQGQSARLRLAPLTAVMFRQA
ncbi:1,4-alpha-glucan branching protein GlgB [Falsirhodobacter sp. 20TX0035]|uniref:1,4-alpha-glucan branching protein GlgB n=1 Tax=Falsirhodobacter sp. 20TX0035 TaxID=3022019 RepID=UPI00232B0E17|nr:1,4-alpha-glucan branching protein GlgB [Falsirhodobacter sp. 20TX0035]MDB6453196.1 1,4-alpha-glucan branching protein GlgB [Falsirhodobacter sp. 20TX0035]